ncbi:DUF2971 domain-containing protein [Sphingomonas lutea]|uniref:DUF2971 domain-containing protein n=1 Tax=Sphingomonas lutea TaxID=1045317 RepID=A0A7G9SF27_9SPHN|nr:DUF2971 domain-containing protein [Sphingomonas lutea]QNN66452.1 DUF2971 domain-containing protein [Sphingomonas lutea]
MIGQKADDQETVFRRLYRPGGGTPLYHYCNTPSFLAILESGKLRFSDANMMNDGSEGRYGYALFERAANALLDMATDNPVLEGLDAAFFDKIDAYLSPKQLHSHPIIACFSKSPDVLSQWRAYASDGQGWSIGFPASALAAMPVSLLEVLYDPDQQLREVRNHLGAMYAIWKESEDRELTSIRTEVALFASWLHAYKDPTFAEEQEVRALHELRVDIGENGLLLVDEGGVAEGAEVGGETVQFRTDGTSITAFVDIPFRAGKGGEIIELWFGPRNNNGLGNALYPMTQYGHPGVRLRHSASFYRG